VSLARRAPEGAADSIPSPKIWRAYVCHKITGMTDKELYQIDGMFKHRIRVGQKRIRCAYDCRACAFPPCGSCGKVLANALPIDEAHRKSKAGESSYRVVYPAKGSQKDKKYILFEKSAKSKSLFLDRFKPKCMGVCGNHWKWSQNRACKYDGNT
jgi:hypothetical protein